MGRLKGEPRVVTVNGKDYFKFWDYIENRSKRVSCAIEGCGAPHPEKEWPRLRQAWLQRRSEADRLGLDARQQRLWEMSNAAAYRKGDRANAGVLLSAAFEDLMIRLADAAQAEESPDRKASLRFVRRTVGYFAAWHRGPMPGRRRRHSTMSAAMLMRHLKEAERVRTARPWVGPKERKAVYERDSHTCVYCGAHGKSVHLTLDHFVPVKLGGETILENLRTACTRCNNRKYDHFPTPEVLQSLREGVPIGTRRQARRPEKGAA